MDKAEDKDKGETETACVLDRCNFVGRIPVQAKLITHRSVVCHTSAYALRLSVIYIALNFRVGIFEVKGLVFGLELGLELGFRA